MNAVVLRSGGGRPAVIAVRKRSMRSGSGRGPVAAVGVRRHLGAGYQHRHPTLAGTAAVLQDVACSGPAREWAIRLHLSHGPPLRLRGRMAPALIGWQQSPLLSLRWLWRHLRSPACEGAGGPARGQGPHLRPLRLESRLYTRAAPGPPPASRGELGGSWRPPAPSARGHPRWRAALLRRQA
jgi:hypothetical protein